MFQVIQSRLTNHADKPTASHPVVEVGGDWLGCMSRSPRCARHAAHFKRGTDYCYLANLSPELNPSSVALVPDQISLCNVAQVAHLGNPTHDLGYPSGAPLRGGVLSNVFRELEGWQGVTLLAPIADA